MPPIGTVPAATSGEYLGEEELLRLPMFSHLKPKTLAKWRSTGKGPSFTRIGRKVFYRVEALTLWLLSKEQVTEPNLAALRTIGQVPVLPASRFGRHVTKADIRGNAAALRR